MKILQVVPYFYPAWSYGGPGKLVYDISSELSKRNHQVEVFTSDAFDKKIRMPDNKKIKAKNSIRVCYFSNISNFLAFKYRIFFTPNFYFKSIFALPKFDLIHVHDFFTLQNAFISLLAKIYHKPYIISPHGTIEPRALKNKTGLKTLFFKFFGNFMISSADFIIASSTDEKKNFLKLGIPKKKIVSLANGINPEEFFSSISKKTARDKLSLPNNKVIFIFLGRVSYMKGLDILIEAINLQASKQAFFVIAGSDNGYLKTLKSKIKKYKLANKVKIMSTCFGKKKADLFKAGDVFVYPSLLEGFSVGILEALSTGLVPLLTKACNFNELTKEQAAVIVQTNNVNDLKKAIEKLADNKKLRQSIARNAKVFIRKNYTQKNIVKKLEKIYLAIT